MSQKIDDRALLSDENGAKKKIAKATVYCVTEPDERQLKGLEEFVCREGNASSAVIEIVKDESLIGGFIIEIGNKQYDRSLKNKLDSMKSAVAEKARKAVSDKDNIISILKEDRGTRL